MAKRVFACLMALTLMVGTVALVGCGDPAPTPGLNADEIAAHKAAAAAKKAADDAKAAAESKPAN